MFKYCFVFFALVTGGPSVGQVQYGLKIGVTQSFVKETPGGFDRQKELKPGFQVGATVDIYLRDNVSFRYAIQMTQKGYKTVDASPESPYYWHRNMSVTYLELPLHLHYHVSIKKTTDILIGAGPVFSIGLFGKGRSILNVIDSTGSIRALQSTETHLFDVPGYRRVDLGTEFLLGFKRNNMSFTAHYNHGLTNILNSDQGIQATKNRSFALSVGYFLHRKRGFPKG